MLAATALALASAGLHAGWNLFIKTSEDRFLAAWGQWLFGGLLFLPALAVLGLPSWRDALPYLVGSALVHVAYVSALVAAYHHGDFSFAYPLARGSGALLAAVGGVVWLGDHLGAAAWAAIVVVMAGLVSLVGPAVDRPSISWALLTGVSIGTYTTLDAAGARASSGFAYGIATTMGGALAVSAWGLLRGRGPALRDTLKASWRRYAAAGFGLTAAYALVMAAVALPDVPVGYVAVLRESSVVIGAAVGWLVLREHLGGRRLVSSCVIASGLAALVVLR